MSHFIRRAFLSLVPLLLLLCACEQTVDVDTPFVERLVVRSFLEPGANPLVEISHTLPLDRSFRHRDQWIENARGTIGEENAVPTRLRQALDSTGYYSSDTLHVVPGRRYHLAVEWNGKHVEAETRVPFPPRIVYCRRDTTIDRSDNSLDISVVVGIAARAGEYYGGTIASIGPTGRRTYPLLRDEDVLGIEDTTAGGIIEIRSDADRYRSGDLVVTITAYDHPFRAFVRTFYADFDNGEAFATGADLVAWNVEGDGIGIFIGRASIEQAVR